MKFSDITMEQWAELKPYLDTVVLPVTGLCGAEAPYEAVERLERLRDLLDAVEIPFKGRIVTYPAFHYIGDRLIDDDSLERLCSRLKVEQFRYAIIIRGDEPSSSEHSLVRPVSCDLLLDSSNLMDAKQLVQEMWNRHVTNS